MSSRQEFEVRIGARWGEGSVLLEGIGGETFRGPLPVQIAPLADEGRSALIYLSPQGRLDGWSFPEEKVGVRMDDDRRRRDSSQETLECQGQCQTVWYAVAGGIVPPDDGCLTCGALVTAS